MSAPACGRTNGKRQTRDPELPPGEAWTEPRASVTGHAATRRHGDARSLPPKLGLVARRPGPAAQGGHTHLRRPGGCELRRGRRGDGPPGALAEKPSSFGGAVDVLERIIRLLADARVFVRISVTECDRKSRIIVA